MGDFESASLLEAITHSIEFQIRKHGQYFGHTTVEDAVNAMSDFELSTMIAEYLESQVVEDNLDDLF